MYLLLSSLQIFVLVALEQQLRTLDVRISHRLYSSSNRSFHNSHILLKGTTNIRDELSEVIILSDVKVRPQFSPLAFTNVYLPFSDSRWGVDPLRSKSDRCSK
jgi:hypothetical protein